MINLNSIDLTQNKRFERIVNDAEQEKIDARWNNDRGIRRLKKGEIPHRSNTNSITVTNSDNITINTLSDWVVFGDDPSWRISTNDFTTSITSTNSSNITWHISEEVVGQTFIVDNDMYSYNATTNWYVTSKPSKNKDVHDRLCMDPFYENIISTSSIKQRLSKDEDPIYIHYQKRDSIKNRLNYKSEYNRHISDVDRMFLQLRTPSIIDRMLSEQDDELEVEDNWFTIGHHSRQDSSKLLRKKAPFIKRVYTTNRGMSFDSTELNYELALAKERFDLLVRSQI